MFRVADTFNLSSNFARETEANPVSIRKAARASFDPIEEIGALTHVYSEIARRLSRNAYTSHNVARAR